MREFYRLRADKPELSIAQALQEAQLELLRGTAATAGAKTERGVRLEGGADNFVPDERAPFAHSYYWSPFVLMGNWR